MQTVFPDTAAFKCYSLNQQRRHRFIFCHYKCISYWKTGTKPCNNLF